jgi:feruloyl esterase
MGRNVYLAIVVMVLCATVAAADTCSDLMTNAALRALPNTTIDSASTVTGAFTPPGATAAIQGLPSFCRVAATLKPSAESDIKIEVWLPTTGWNGKFQGVGNGGLGGVISYTNNTGYLNLASLADQLKAGYAVASTDTGHVNNDRAWLANVEKQRDYIYRSIHEMTVAGKAVVKAYYGSDPRRSYFNGCSTGGGQALSQAQRYPADYDGILAGASQYILGRVRAGDIWAFQNTNSENRLTPAQVTLIQQTVMRECGTRDGSVQDGFLSNPLECRWNPTQLLCKPGQDAATCLTQPQIDLMNKLTGGYVTKSGQQITGGLWGPGAVAWGGFNRVYLSETYNNNSPAAQFYGLGVLQIPNFDAKTVDIDAAVAAGEQKFNFVNNNSPDLDAFIRRGGKLIMYHGWDDPSISAVNSISYYRSVAERMRDVRRLNSFDAALAETQKNARLFLIPGTQHCGNGPGANTFDAIGVLDQWVERGSAPDKIIASHATPAFSRVLCPYPQAARYDGSGDRNDASNWACVSN